MPLLDKSGPYSGQWRPSPVVSGLDLPLQRTFLRNAAGEIEYVNHAYPDVPHAEVGTPDYADLPLTEYLSVLEVLNPMHRLWSDGRWNKLTVAHGCYWKRCSFCDVTLDYISALRNRAQHPAGGPD